MFGFIKKLLGLKDEKAEIKQEAEAPYKIETPPIAPAVSLAPEVAAPFTGFPKSQVEEPTPAKVSETKKPRGRNPQGQKPASIKPAQPKVPKTTGPKPRGRKPKSKT